tara:strand:+ start:1874 stop:2326 length:453 start_codon:yes stop_codon:yes gene_type:complete
MATSTLIQYLEGTDAAGVSLGTTPSNRRQTETFIAAEAIAGRDAVSLALNKPADGDISLYVQKATSNVTSDTCFVGVALTGAAAGEKIQVCIAGVCEANTSASAQGKSLAISTTAGRLVDYANSDVLPIAAVATQAHSGNVATVVVLKQF